MPIVISAGPAQSPVLESDSMATTPAPTSPSAPSTASTPPVGSSSSATSSAMAISAIRTKASMPRLSAFAVGGERTPLDVGPQLALLGVRALLEIDQLTLAVIEGRVGKAEAGAEALFDVLVGVGVARVGDGRLREEGVCGVLGVPTVDSEERDPSPILGRHPLQGGELEAAGPAPRGPYIDDDRISAQRLDSLLVGVPPAVQQLVGLPVQRGQRRRRPGKGLLIVGMLAAVVAAALARAAARGEQRHRHQRPDPGLSSHLRHFGDYNT